MGGRETRNPRGPDSASDCDGGLLREAEGGNKLRESCRTVARHALQNCSLGDPGELRTELPQIRPNSADLV